ncbi:MAG: DUF4388 domain-containing protein [Phycisphaerae bacterium]|nr:DUF4388 domain-containing protein [Gemmatimonadaceae bacterium]
MGLEGNLRELALQEVLQLLAHTRKTGNLCISAPLAGLSACIVFENGAVVDATIDGLPPEDGLMSVNGKPDRSRAVESAVLELLGWQDGTFTFVPRVDRSARAATGVRLNTDVLLMEGARRVDAWSRLGDRIPNARVVPGFVGADSRHLPLLNLLPQQWEVLTGVDGQRDILALSKVLGRDLLETAEIVYELLETGLLRVVNLTAVAATHATPPSSVALRDSDAQVDLWVPEESAGSGAFHDDDIFDPIRVGVITPDGLPRLRTPTRANVVLVAHQRQLGDEAARRGDLAGALSHWSTVLDTNRDGPDADHAREAMALANRLSELLGVHP